MSSTLTNSSSHRYYGSPVAGAPRPSPTGEDNRQTWGTVQVVTGDALIVDILPDGTVRRRTAKAGMTLFSGDAVETHEGSVAVRLACGQSLHVTSKSYVFVIVG
jgi:hypothetical protein